jgi:outer membrane receptor protein involved in Fe transport
MPGVRAWLSDRDASWGGDVRPDAACRWGFRPNVFSALLAANRRAGTHGIAEKMMSGLPFLTESLLLTFVLSCFASVARAEQNPGGYALLNLLVEWPFEAGWTAFARLDNLLDKHYELAAHYRTAGANLFAGVRWRY